MLPEHILSSQPILGTFLLPDKEPSLLTSRELGGVGLNDSSTGMQIQIWDAFMVGDTVTVSSPNTPATPLFTFTNISEISLTFDQNMHPFVAYVKDGQSFFYWFDPVPNQQVHTALPQECYSPRCALDDHRIAERSTSDIILAYMRATDLYYREERDRYTIEYTLRLGIDIPIGNPRLDMLGMTSVNRVQFALVGSIYQ